MNFTTAFLVVIAIIAATVFAQDPPANTVPVLRLTYTISEAIDRETWLSSSTSEYFTASQILKNWANAVEGVAQFDPNANPHKSVTYFTNFQTVINEISWEDHSIIDSIYNTANNNKENLLSIVNNGILDVKNDEKRNFSNLEFSRYNIPDTCANNLKDDNETDVDCGGPCLPCTFNSPCKVSKDCGFDSSDAPPAAECADQATAPPQCNYKVTACENSKCSFFGNSAFTTSTLIAMVMIAITTAAVFF